MRKRKIHAELIDCSRALLGEWYFPRWWPPQAESSQAVAGHARSSGLHNCCWRVDVEAIQTVLVAGHHSSGSASAFGPLVTLLLYHRAIELNL